MKYVYSFQEGNQKMRNTLGGKGANLAEMTALGLPVPEGFTVSTEACTKYYEDQLTLKEEIIEEILEQLKQLERITGKQFGNPENPLLVSVRSGARISMPGMMDTVLNLGMNEKVCKSLAERSENPRFAYDSYRRLIQMYSDVVMNLPKESFEGLFDQIKEEKQVEKDTELTIEDLKEVIQRYQEQYQKLTGTSFPTDPKVQLLEAIKAVFRSWNTPRAKTYRKLNGIPESWGTAVNIQRMVYGNRGETSGTGVAFTRNPATGENELYGEYLMNAQGEDVVAGIRTPRPISTLQEIMPECFEEFKQICKKLEEHYKDMQDMEFTIEEGKLYMLQTRSGKRTAHAAIKIAVDLVHQQMISKEEALLRVEPSMLEQLLHPVFLEEALQKVPVIATGLAASPGAATGKIYFTAEDIKRAYQRGEKDLILVREETSPEDIEGMNLAEGVLTVRGGMTSHAAVVARGMGTCCISGCQEIIVDSIHKTLTTKEGKIFHEQDNLSLDGSTGKVYGEKIATKEAEISGDFEEFMSWADQTKHLEIRTNADVPRDAKIAKKFGAEGIGLCRTEHMFFEKERIFQFRRMIMAPTKELRKEALDKILPYQKQDFIGLFMEMENLPVTIRLLDPPLHEFLPKKEEEIISLAKSLQISYEELKEKIESLKEFNPMMGHRGCRLDITYPEIAKMQARAIIEAAIEVEEKGIKTKPEMMIPLVMDKKELSYVKELLTSEIEKVQEEKKRKIDYKIGTMIELPRATILADELAEEAEFFSFGTNDLTQLTYGFSRDDSPKFLNDYYEKQILDQDPFASIDERGVGKLIELASGLGRKTRPNIELGICGEHGGDPKSIAFCNQIGLTYVSCSPYRIPTARLAASQASIRENRKI